MWNKKTDLSMNNNEGLIKVFSIRNELNFHFMKKNYITTKSLVNVWGHILWCKLRKRTLMWRNSIDCSISLWCLCSFILRLHRDSCLKEMGKLKKKLVYNIDGLLFCLSCKKSALITCRWNHTAFKKCFSQLQLLVLVMEDETKNKKSFLTSCFVVVMFGIFCFDWHKPQRHQLDLKLLVLYLVHDKL